MPRSPKHQTPSALRGFFCTFRPVGLLIVNLHGRAVVHPIETAKWLAHRMGKDPWLMAGRRMFPGREVMLDNPAVEDGGPHIA